MKIIYESDLVTLMQGDCFNVMDQMFKKEYKVDLVITSPPYNTGRNQLSQKARDNHEGRYDIYEEVKTNEDYRKWTTELFNSYDKVLNKNGVILYNLSYGGENPSTMWLVIADIINNTEFMIADCIIWHKSHCLPNNMTHNKLSRITEFIFVICRKNEFKTFNANKKVKSISRTGQKYYENIYNFINAKNTSWVCPLNKAIFSLELVDTLLKIYYTGDGIVYDSFSGSGTTLVACQRKGIKSIGSELSDGQAIFAKEKLLEDLEKYDNKK